ncbi:hypothetical protein HMI56_005648 [Coelomomyces lativittatus]|nr:hypothetical protein HMI56_005648 [Coelomomyces lativittatus]
MFPTINVSEVHISHIRRVVMFHYLKESDTIAFRHYAIDVQTTGVTKPIKNIISSKNLPDLHEFKDISEYVQRNEVATDSEVEDNEQVVVLPDHYPGRNNKRNDKRAVKLTELGPRMELSLFQIQVALCSGELLYCSNSSQKKSEVVAEEAP